jgi:hypothetical protein
MDRGLQDRLPHERSQTRLDLLGDIGGDAVYLAEHVRGQELVMVGEMPVERLAQLIWLLLHPDRRRLEARIHGRPRSDRKKRFLLSAVAPSTIARHPRKQGPSTGHSAAGLLQAGKLPTDAEATFHGAIMQLGNQVVDASDGAPFREERRPTRVCRTPGAGSGLLGEASTLRAGTANIPPRRTLGRRTGLFRARCRGRVPGCGLPIGSANLRRRSASVSCDTHAQNAGPAVTSIGYPSTVSSDRPILEGCRCFIGCKSPAIAEKYRQVLARRKWRTS